MSDLQMVFRCRAPSNIAFIKYWGKSDVRTQWPTNDSLSMTLKNCYTDTKAALNQAELDRITFANQILEPHSPFYVGIKKKLDILRSVLETDATFDIVTENSFPTGCGIASSASGMAALAIAVVGAFTQSRSWQDLHDKGFSLNRLSDLARLCSGSACRSFASGFVQWKRGEQHSEQRIHPLASDWHLCDTVVIFDNQPKKTGSSDGHLIATTSPLFDLRLEELPRRLEAVKKAITAQDLDQLGPVIEEEALNMHTVMMTSTPPLHYLTSESLKFLEWIRRQRHAGLFPAYFTIDAGPNIHLIHRPEDREMIAELLAQEFPEKTLIFDETGHGPEIEILSRPTAYKEQKYGDMIGIAVPT